MAIGAEDYIDQLLVKKYAEEKVDNHDDMESMVNPEKMMEAMNDYASVHKNMLLMSSKISDICAGLKAKARYSPHLQAKAS